MFYAEVVERDGGVQLSLAAIRDLTVTQGLLVRDDALVAHTLVDRVQQHDIGLVLQAE